MSCSPLLLFRIGTSIGRHQGLVGHRVASSVAFCTSSSTSKKPAATAAKPTTKPLSPANQKHVEKFLSALISVDKGQVYKNPEYFVFDGLSFYDYEMVMESKRLPQPMSKLTAF